METNMNNEIQAGEIWLAEVDFQEIRGGSKLRPVLVFAGLSGAYQVCRFTTKKVIEHYDTDVLFNEEEAQSMGLNAPCKLMLERGNVVTFDKLHRKIGDLRGLYAYDAMKFKKVAKAAAVAGLF